MYPVTKHTPQSFRLKGSLIYRCFKASVKVIYWTLKSKLKEQETQASRKFKEDDTLIVIHKQKKTQLIPLLPSPPFPSSFLPAVLLFHQSSYLAGQLTPFQDDSSAVPSRFSAAHTGLEPRKNFFFLRGRNLKF